MTNTAAWVCLRCCELRAGVAATCADDVDYSEPSDPDEVCSVCGVPPAFDERIVAFQRIKHSARQQLRDDVMWTVQDTATYLRCERDKVYELHAKGQIPARKIGAHVRFVPADVKRWAAGESGAAESRVLPLARRR